MFEWTFFRNETIRSKFFQFFSVGNRVASTLECHWHNSTPVLHHQLKSCSLCWTHNRRCARPHSRTSQRVLWDPAPETHTHREREKYHRLRVYLKTKENTCCCLWPRLAREPRKPPEPRRNLGRILRQTTDRQTDRLWESTGSEWLARAETSETQHLSLCPQTWHLQCVRLADRRPTL